jgi:hypothetical protein
VSWKTRTRGSQSQIGKHFPVISRKSLPKMVLPKLKRGEAPLKYGGYSDKSIVEHLNEVNELGVVTQASCSGVKRDHLGRSGTTGAFVGIIPQGEIMIEKIKQAAKIAEWQFRLFEKDKPISIALYLPRTGSLKTEKLADREFWSKFATTKYENVSALQKSVYRKYGEKDWSDKYIIGKWDDLVDAMKRVLKA